ncbi:hypothetical protein NFI96_003855, partial [Prochilodus magdalenae]
MLPPSWPSLQQVLLCPPAKSLLEFTFRYDYYPPDHEPRQDLISALLWALVKAKAEGVRATLGEVTATQTDSGSRSEVKFRVEGVVRDRGQKSCSTIRQTLAYTNIPHILLARRAPFSSKREAASQVQECLAEIGHGGESSDGWETAVLLDKEEKLAELWSGEECLFNVSSPLYHDTVEKEK